MRIDRIEQLLVRQLGVAEAELAIRRAFLAEDIAWETPIRSTSCRTSAREGGVLRYSTTCGSIPALRIMARVLRDVPRAGLW
jgi:hypothetical protein